MLARRHAEIPRGKLSQLRASASPKVTMTGGGIAMHMFEHDDNDFAT